MLTPKSSRVEQDGNGQRELLFESRQLRAIEAEYEQSPKTFDDAAKAAMLVASLVRETLDFASTGHFSQPLRAEIIAETKVANCFGHTIVASECLERLGIEHFISYANQHTFVTLFDRQSDRSFMIDVKTRELCCEMTGVIGRENPLNQLQCGQLRAENSLFTDDLLLRQLPPSVNREDFLAVREWLRFSDPQSEHRDSRRGSILQMFTLPSIPGRLLLLDEYNARIDNCTGSMRQQLVHWWIYLVYILMLIRGINWKRWTNYANSLLIKVMTTWLLKWLERLMKVYRRMIVQKLSYFYLTLYGGLPKRIRTLV